VEPQGALRAFPEGAAPSTAQTGVKRRDPPRETKENPVATTTLTRPTQGRVIAGVCAGLADRFGWNANLVRLLFLLSCLLPGPQFVIYIVLWVLMPSRQF
jgi:phage shock protein PspC (stress-responsive transcriptional regulator)